MHTTQKHLPEKQKTSSQFFRPLFKSKLSFEPFQKKMALIGYVFLNLQTLKDVFGQKSKKSHLR